jgi:23S rRNA A2030 N6-methylase RlmJ
MAPFGARIAREDGFAMALALAPPVPRRGLVLIDPSYEVKEDYAAIRASSRRSAGSGTWGSSRSGIRS